MTRAAGYVRVSTQEQVEHGLNLAEDRQRIRERADAEGWELVEIFDDGGHQGDDPDRPELASMIASLPDLDVVILRDLDRLSRDPVIHGFACNAFRKNGVKLVSFLTGPIDIETPQGEFASNLFAAVGKLEKRQTSERVKLNQAARRRAGLPVGSAPFGFRWQD